MNPSTLKILEEFGDDVQRVCEEVIELRETREELETKIEDLREEISSHECSTE